MELQQGSGLPGPLLILINMEKIYENRKSASFGMEGVDQTKLKSAAKKLKVHPGWLVNQAVNLAINNPDALFDNMKRQFKGGLIS